MTHERCARIYEKENGWVIHMEMTKDTRHLVFNDMAHLIHCVKDYFLTDIKDDDPPAPE